MLQITNLHATVGDKPILKGLTLSLNAGEIHAIMGPNGAGKSTLGYVLSGGPGYEVTEGSVTFTPPRQAKALSRFWSGDAGARQGLRQVQQGIRVGRIGFVRIEPHERAAAGLFLGFQYPGRNSRRVERPVPARSAERAAQASRRGPAVGRRIPEGRARTGGMRLGMDMDMLKRPVNVGFSGGEKKRNEMVQMGIIDPALAILDETDSGLDIDALRVVGDGINRIMRRPDKAVLLITHYQRLLDYVKPDFVHVLDGGRITRTGGRGTGA